MPCMPLRSRVSGTFCSKKMEGSSTKGRETEVEREDSLRLPSLELQSSASTPLEERYCQAKSRLASADIGGKPEFDSLELPLPSKVEPPPRVDAHRFSPVEMSLYIPQSLHSSQVLLISRCIGGVSGEGTKERKATKKPITSSLIETLQIKIVRERLTEWWSRFHRHDLQPD